MMILGITFLLGALHALGPGHGKSLMAAYLVGSNGRVMDVLVLAFTLTVSHVFSVIILGFIAFWLSDFFLPEQLSKWIGLLSGGSIVAIGGWLMYSRVGVVKAAGRSHEHHHHAQHGYVDDKSNDCDENPHQSHHAHVHYDSGFSLRHNLVLGISGGIVPCPQALIILLLAISMQKVMLGMLIIVVFSMGLSSVLIGLGIVMIRASHLLKDHLVGQRILYLPVIAAAMITGLGLFLTMRSLLLFTL